MNEFYKLGDVVVFNGTRMTINRIIGGYYECVWHDKRRNPWRRWLPESKLAKEL